MRIDLKKVLFYGVKGSVESFFNQAQDLGIVEFIDKNKSKIKEVPFQIHNLMHSIKVLRTLPVIKQEELYSLAEADPLAEKVLVLKASLQRSEDDLRTIKLKIEEILPFGKFSLQDIAFIESETGRMTQFFLAKKGLRSLEKLPDEVILVHSDNEFDYFLSISTKRIVLDKMIELKFSEDLNALQARSIKTTDQIHQIEQELKGYSKYNTYLHEALRKQLNDLSLITAKRSAQPVMEGSIFAVEGWVPENKMGHLKAFVEKMHVQSEEILADPDEKIPTYLENKGFSKVGEDLVCFYDTPSKGDDDPSLWVLGFFALFFAVIVGDGGYGLVFLATALYLRYKNPKMQGSTKRAWKLFTLLCVSCIAWGVLTNSFFGISFAPDSPMRKVSLLHWMAEKKAAYHFDHKDAEYARWVGKYPDLANAPSSREFLLGAKTGTAESPAYEMISSFNDSALIEIALFLGMMHIIFSFLRYIKRNPTGIGWIIAILGGYFYFPSFLNATSFLHYALGLNAAHLAASGYYMIFTGIGLALAIAIYQRRLMGILELTSITAIFADILSYLRLYALGLSGSVVTATINDIAGSINLTFLAVALWLVGHTINMALSVVGGVIHGLRLNFIEWYHYSFEGGGKAFDPLKKIN
jgi:V/A-type H+-transporting ATPase subunit I